MFRTAYDDDKKFPQNLRNECYHNVFIVPKFAPYESLSFTLINILIDPIDIPGRVSQLLNEINSRVSRFYHTLLWSAFTVMPRVHRASEI